MRTRLAQPFASVLGDPMLRNGYALIVSAAATHVPNSLWLVGWHSLWLVGRCPALLAAQAVASSVPPDLLCPPDCPVTR